VKKEHTKATSREVEDGEDVHDGVIDKVRDGRKDPSVTLRTG
jgi:hypothetical protein